MTGSQMAGFFSAFLKVPAAIAGVVLLALGFFLPPPWSYLPAVAGALAMYLSVYLWLSELVMEARQRRLQAEEEERFAAAQPHLYRALMEVNAICLNLPGYKRLRFDSAAGKKGELSITIWAHADSWSEAEDKQPLTVGGMPIKQWQETFPARIGDYGLTFSYVRAPISLGWVGGLSTGIWDVSARN